MYNLDGCHCDVKAYLICTNVMHNANEMYFHSIVSHFRRAALKCIYRAVQFKIIWAVGQLIYIFAGSIGTFKKEKNKING